MTQVVTQVGGGTGDTTSGSGFYNYGAGQDWVSQYYFPDTLAHGGFTTSAGTAFNTTVKQFNVVDVTLRLGGTSAGNAAASTGYIELATANTGGGGYNDSTNTFTLSGSVASKSTGTIDWNVAANTMYYYGYYQTGGVAYTVFATGTAYANGLNGTTPDFWFNGTAKGAGQRISGSITTQTIPTAPTTPTLGSATTTSITLNWGAGTDDGTQTTAAWADSSTRITGYNIVYKKSSDSAWTLGVLNTGILTPSAGVYSYTITGLTAGTSYDFKIGALNRTTTAINTATDLTKATGVRSATGTMSTLTISGGVRTAGGTWTPFNTPKIYRTHASPTWSSSSQGIQSLVTVTVSAGHSFATGDSVTLIGFGTVQQSPVTVTRVSSTVFTYLYTSAGVTATGTGTSVTGWAGFTNINRYNGTSWVQIK